MIREQVKEILPILQAFVEGKEIQSLTSDDRWVDGGEFLSKFDIEVMVTNPEFFRIKPEPKYRPFQSAEECWQEMQKHQPFGWIKASHGQFFVTGVRDTYASFGCSKGNWESYDYIFDEYTFADGEPFGVKEE